MNGQKPNWSVHLLEEKVPKADEVDNGDGIQDMGTRGRGTRR
jgi:hypothetical protein